MARKKLWIIKGWDSMSLTYEHEIHQDQITEKNLKELLRVLCAKISLSEEEIIDSYLKEGTEGHRNLLVVSRSMGGKKIMYTCGENPHITAEIGDKEV